MSLPTIPADNLPRHPEELNACFAHAFNTGDVEQVLALFEPAGQLVSARGGVCVGWAAIRAELAGYLQRGGTMRIANRVALEFEDFALLRSEWEINFAAGAPATLRGAGLEVGRRQPDGTWRFVLDHPFGAAGG